MPWKTGMTMTSKDVLIFNPAHLSEGELSEFISDNSFRLFLICKRKKLIFDRCDTTGQSYNESVFYYLDKGQKRIISTVHAKAIEVVEHKVGKLTFTIDGKSFEEADHKLINYLFFDGNISIPNPEGKQPEPLPTDLEVVFVGHSFGFTLGGQINKNFTAHGKILEISNRILSAGAGEEVLVVGMNYTVGDAGTLTVDPDIDISEITPSRLLHLREKKSKRIIESQEITLFEAGMIYYFQPQFNSDSAGNIFLPQGFPSLEKIFSLGSDYSTYEINTISNYVRLFSSVAEPRLHVHIGRFSIQAEEQKNGSLSVRPQ